MRKLLILIFTLLSIQVTFCQVNSEESKAQTKKEENKTEETHSYFQMDEWQNLLDEKLKKDSTVAYFWQLKSMPYFKTKKYEIGMKYVDKAVKYDSKNWQPYRAFIKCIFAKTHKEAILDFEDCKKKLGNGYVMDHTFNFYIGLSYLQLNEFIKAEMLFKEYVEDLFKNRQGLEHPTALFYYGISKYEQKKWEEAIIEFDRALKIYPNFSDVKYYKAMCLLRLGKKENVSKLVEESKIDAKSGYTINEDNVIHEIYPYQVKWNNL